MNDPAGPVATNDFSERHLSRCLVAGSMDVEVGGKK